MLIFFHHQINRPQINLHQTNLHQIIVNLQGRIALAAELRLIRLIQNLAMPSRACAQVILDVARQLVTMHTTSRPQSGEDLGEGSTDSELNTDLDIQILILLIKIHVVKFNAFAIRISPPHPRIRQVLIFGVDASNKLNNSTFIRIVISGDQLLIGR
jgi:hypothetical protein